LNNADFVYVEVAPDPNCFNPGNAQSQIISIQVTPVGAELVAGIVGIDTLVCAGGLAVIQAQNPAFIPDVTYSWLVNGVEQPSQTSDILSYVPLQAVDTVQVVMTALSGTQSLSKSVDTSATILVYTSPLSTVKDSLRLTSPANNVFLCPGTPVTYALGSNLEVPFNVEWYANDTLKSSGTDTTYTFTGLSGTVRIRAVVKFDSSLTCLATNGPAGIDSTINYVLQFLPANDPREYLHLAGRVGRIGQQGSVRGQGGRVTTILDQEEASQFDQLAEFLGFDFDDVVLIQSEVNMKRMMKREMKRGVKNN
jgi:hypothetical protein